VLFEKPTRARDLPSSCAAENRSGQLAKRACTVVLLSFTRLCLRKKTEKLFTSAVEAAMAAIHGIPLRGG
jgi:hypothetical protein